MSALPAGFFGKWEQPAASVALQRYPHSPVNNKHRQIFLLNQYQIAKVIIQNTRLSPFPLCLVDLLHHYFINAGCGYKH